MQMNSYVHNPQLFRRHFAGKSLEAFRGKRVQRGRGLAYSFLKRVAVPLLSAAAPHIVGAASSLARRLTAKAFPKHKRMQRIVGDVVRSGAGAAVAHVQKRATRKRSANLSSAAASPSTKKKRRKTTTTTTAARTRGKLGGSVKRKSGYSAQQKKQRKRRNIFND